MEKTKRNYTIALAVLLVAAVLMSATIGGILYRRSGSDKLVDRSNDVYTSFGAGFTDIKITDEDSALQAVNSVKDSLGISDTKKEIHYNVTQKYGGNKYYRMQQYVGDVPVYGRTLVIGADKNGNPLSLNSNYRPIGKTASTTPLGSKETVRQNVAHAVSVRTGKDVTLKENAVSDKNLTYYDFGTEKSPSLAYVVPVKVAGETVEYIASAETGEVLEETSKVPVPNTEISLVDHGEPGALKVAYAELFGTENKGDLQAAQDPVAAGYPVEYRGENWGSTMSEEDNGYVNKNYTVFTHAVTQMLSGMDGASETISEDDMITLLVGTLLRFNLDETFYQAADTFYAEAQYLASTGKLTSAQLTTVASALAAAGLPVADDATVVITPTETEKKTTSKGEMEVVKTMTYAYGPEVWEATYEYDLDNKVLNISNSVIKGAEGEWGDPGDHTTAWDGMFWSTMLVDFPELAVAVKPDGLYEDYLMLAYHPLILSGDITHVQETINIEKSGNSASIEDSVSQWETKFQVENGRLMKLTTWLLDGDVDVGTALEYKYDSTGRVKSICEEYGNEWLNVKYETNKERLTKVIMTEPQEPSIYTYIYSGVFENGKIASLHYRVIDEQYVEDGDWDHPKRQEFVNENGRAKYDDDGYLVSVQYSEKSDSTEMKYDKKGRLISVSEPSGSPTITFTYQTIQLP